MLGDLPLAPALVLRWLISLFNIEFDLNTRKLTLSLIKVDLAPKKDDGHTDQA